MPAPTNHALTSTVTATSNWPTYTPDKVKNGLFGYPGWMAASGSVTNQSLYFDFASAVTFDKIEIILGQESTNSNVKDYEIYVSDDGASWGSAITSGTLANTNNICQYITFSSETHRYLQIKFLNNYGHATQMGHVYEVRVYTSATELISGAHYESSNGLSGAIGNITDNNLTTSSYATADGIPWRFDLGASYWVDNLTFFSWETANYQPYEVQMWASADGLVWKAIGTAQTCTYASLKAIIVLSFPKLYTRYVGFSAMRSTGVQGFMCYEMRVYQQSTPTAWAGISGLTSESGMVAASWTAYEAAACKSYRVYIRAGSAPDVFGTSSAYFLAEIENDATGIWIGTLADKVTQLSVGTQYYVIVRPVFQDDTESTDTTCLNQTPSAGSAVYPAEAYVVIGAGTYGPTGVEYTPAFDEAARNTDPGIAKVESGTNYKIQNVSKTGTLAVVSITSAVSTIIN